MQCDECGMNYDTREDTDKHNFRHLLFKVAATSGLVVDPHPARHEERKREARARLDEDPADLAALEAMARAHWERSATAAIDAEAWNQHPLFDRYAAAYTFDDPEQERAWRAAHPLRPSERMPPGKSFWRVTS